VLLLAAADTYVRYTEARSGGRNIREREYEPSDDCATWEGYTITQIEFPCRVTSPAFLPPIVLSILQENPMMKWPELKCSGIISIFTGNILYRQVVLKHINVRSDKDLVIKYKCFSTNLVSHVPFYGIMKSFNFKMFLKIVYITH